MSYDSIEARVQTLLMTLSSYFKTSSTTGEKSVSRGNYRVLDNADINTFCAVLLQGPFSDNMSGQTSGMNKGTRQWGMSIELYVRYTDDETAPVDMIHLTQAIVDLLDAYPMLNNLTGTGRGIGLSINGGDMPHDITDENGGGVYFRTRTITLSVEEYVEVANLE